MTTLIDGKKVSSQIRDKISQETAEFIEKTGIQPHLVVIIVGNNPASMTYVRNKKKSCIILIIILKTPIRWFIMNRLIGVFCWKFLE